MEADEEPIIVEPIWEPLCMGADMRADDYGVAIVRLLNVNLYRADNIIS